MLPSPFGGRLGPRGYSFSRPQCVHCCYGPVTRNLPSGGLVDRLRRFCFHLLRYPNYGALTSTPAGLFHAEHASLHWTHNRTRTNPFQVRNWSIDRSHCLPCRSPQKTCPRASRLASHMSCLAAAMIRSLIAVICGRNHRKTQSLRSEVMRMAWFASCRFQEGCSVDQARVPP